jgi:hypothetical protein
LFSVQEDQDTKISRQEDVDCVASYFDDTDIEQYCILQMGHDGKHVDITGVEF